MSNKTSDKNVVNIERLNNFANMTFLYGHRVNLNVSGLKGVQQDIKNVLAEREQQDKRIKELEEQVKTLDEAYTGTIKESKKWFDIAHNSILKQVVIDKINENSNIIKEIEEKIKEEENSGDICREYIRDLKRQKGLVKRDILTLQELLEGAGK